MEENAQELEIPAVSLTPDIQPYMFEPKASQEDQENSFTEGSASDSETDGQMEERQRLRDTEWCDCSLCHVMPTALECLCCTEVDIIDEKRGDLSCITLHDGFIANCLNRDVIEVSLYEYVSYEGPLDDNEPIHETYRYVAYRRFVRWVWHRLGKHMRKVLPACVVRKIRDTFLSQEYTGFKYAIP